MGDDQTINQKIMQWLLHKEGTAAVQGPDKKAGCTAIIEMGLRAVQAKSFKDYDQPTSENFIWGTPIADLDDLQPGDILQFRDHSFTIDTQKFGGGSSTEGPHVRPHHTAFVTKIVKKGIIAEVLEQHVKPSPGKVLANTIYLTNDMSHDQVSSTKVTVKGTVWAFRPQAK